VFWQRGQRIGGLDRGAATVVAASIAPDGKHIAFVETEHGRSTLQLTGLLGGPTDPVFSGAGAFANVLWSPDGRWLLLDWQSADQWLFLRTPVKKLSAVSNIRANFGADPTLAGWCCP
jgi:Tol biopolymer transport system component